MSEAPLAVIQAKASGWKPPKPGRLLFWACVAGCGRGYWAPKDDHIVGYVCRTCRRSARAWNRRSKQ